MNRVVTVLLVLASVAVAGLRLAGEKGEFFQAIAHVLVGGLIGSWLASRRRVDGWLALSLTVVEVVAFLISRSR